MLVIDYLWPFYSVGFLKIIHLCGNDYMSQHPLFSKALNCLGGYKNGNQFYQYGYLGLTNWKQRAMAYAYNAYAGGELGLVAYELYHAAERIGFDGWKPEGAVESAAGEIVDYYSPILIVSHEIGRMVIDVTDVKPLHSLNPFKVVIPRLGSLLLAALTFCKLFFGFLLASCLNLATTFQQRKEILTCPTFLYSFTCCHNPNILFRVQNYA